jgi:hypothetical protein
MKRALLYGLAVLCLTFPLLNIQAQSMSHEEEVVRNAYARFSFVCSLRPITQVAVPQLGGLKIDSLKLDAQVQQATPSYVLSDFKVGPISEIANDPWRDFVTPPSQNGEILQSGEGDQSYSDNGNVSRWKTAEVEWTPSPYLSPEAENTILNKTVVEIIKIASPQWQNPKDPLVNYTRYAAFTVDVTLAGKSSGPHKAIFFFGTDAKGKEYVGTNDVISGPSPLDIYANKPSLVEPSGLLLGKFREAPAVANWLRANIMSDPSCSESGQTMCCMHGRCGISSAAFNRDLSTPLPAPKN